MASEIAWPNGVGGRVWRAPEKFSGGYAEPETRCHLQTSGKRADHRRREAGTAQDLSAADSPVYSPDDRAVRVQYQPGRKSQSCRSLTNNTRKCGSSATPFSI